MWYFRRSGFWTSFVNRKQMRTHVFNCIRLYVLQNIEKLVNMHIIRNFSVSKLFNLGSLAQRCGYDIIWTNQSNCESRWSSPEPPFPPAGQGIAGSGNEIALPQFRSQLSSHSVAAWWGILWGNGIFRSDFGYSQNYPYSTNT